MNREEILYKVKVNLVECLGVPMHALDERTDINADLGADSLDTVEIAMIMEEAFGIRIPESEICNCPYAITIGRLTDIIETKLKEKDNN